MPRGPVVATATPGDSRSRSRHRGSAERLERLLVEHGRRDAALSSASTGVARGGDDDILIAAGWPRELQKQR